MVPANIPPGLAAEWVSEHAPSQKLAPLTWEAILAQSKHHRVIGFKRAHLLMCKGDLRAALLLSQLVYWFSPGEDGQTRARKMWGGKLFVAKSHTQIEEETGLSRQQSTAAVQKLVTLGLIETQVHRFEGHAMRWIHLKRDAFAMRWSKVVQP